MRKASNQRAWMLRIWERDGAYPQTSRNFYKAVVQVTLLFRAESWVMSPRIGRTMGGFHFRVPYHMSKVHPKRYVTGRWIYPPLDVAMKSVEMEEVETYVLRLQNTVAQYIATWPILELCLTA